MRTWLTVREAASLAKVSPDTIYRACAQGALRHVRLNGRRAIRMQHVWLEQWLVAQVQEPVVIASPADREGHDSLEAVRSSRKTS